MFGGVGRKTRQINNMLQMRSTTHNPIHHAPYSISI